MMGLGGKNDFFSGQGKMNEASSNHDPLAFLKKSEQAKKEQEEAKLLQAQQAQEDFKLLK